MTRNPVVLSVLSCYGVIRRHGSLNGWYIEYLAMCGGCSHNRPAETGRSSKGDSPCSSNRTLFALFLKGFTLNHNRYMAAK